MFRRIEQTDHSGLDQIVHLHVGGHAAHQVIGNAFDQIGMFEDQLLLRYLIDRDALVHERFGRALLRV